MSKFLSYILERRPDEFGLIEDPDGYVKIKDLLKAISEEEGWGYVRKAAIDEVLFTLPNPPAEISGNLIRAKNRENLPKQIIAKDLPKLLYTCVRRKAHGFVLEKGILPQAYPKIILSSNRELAERMGKRADQSPILLTVQVQKSAAEGVVFYQAGEAIYLADAIPPGCFSAPPLPKQKAEEKKPEPAEAPPVQKFPGSFFIHLDREDDEKKKAALKRKRKEKSKEKDKKRREKQKQRGE